MEDVGICYGHLVYFTANWYILRPFGIFCGNLVYFPQFWKIWKIWQPWWGGGHFLCRYVLANCMPVGLSCLHRKFSQHLSGHLFQRRINRYIFKKLEKKTVCQTRRDNISQDLSSKVGLEFQISQGGARFDVVLTYFPAAPLGHLNTGNQSNFRRKNIRSNFSSSKCLFSRAITFLWGRFASFFSSYADKCSSKEQVRVQGSQIGRFFAYILGDVYFRQFFDNFRALMLGQNFYNGKTYVLILTKNG
jgi:hypothetical protein